MRKNILILIICLFLVGVFASFYKVSLVGADSGFDSSWDSGGSDWGGSDFGSSSSSGSAGDLFFLVYLLFENPILLLIIVAVVVAIIIYANKKQKEIINKALSSKLELLDVSKFEEEKRLEIEAFNIYKELQFAWMNFDEDSIRKLTTDEMYNMYLMQLDTLKVKNQKNLMYDIKYLGSKIIKRKEDNGVETIVINMQVSCYDFLIDTNTNKVVRGMATKVNYYSYELTFIKTTDSKELDICPQCGAPVKGNNSGECEYCHSTLISNNYTLVMSKKKMLSQK